MNKKLGLGIGLAIAIVIGGIGIVSYMNSNDHLLGIGEKVQVEEVAMTLSLLDEARISRIEIVGERNMMLVKKENKWQNPEAYGLIYNNEEMTDWLGRLCTISSAKVIRGATDLSVFGIDQNARMVTLFDDENNSQTFRIGKIEGEPQMMYISSDQTELIYSVLLEEAQNFLVNPDDFVELELVLPTKAEIESIEWENGEENMTFTKKGEKWFLTAYFESKHEVLPELIDGLVEHIQGFRKDAYVAPVSDENEVAYGLDKNNLQLTLNDQLKITFGKKENGFIYFRVNEEGYIYKMDEELIKPFETIKPFEYISKIVYHASADTLNSVLLTNPQVSYELKMVHKPQIEEETKVVVSTLNEKALDALGTQEVLDLIAEGIQIEALLHNPQMEQKEERKAEMTIVYEHLDGRTKIIELIPYDINYYILRLNGEIEFAVGKESALAMFSKLGQLMKH